LSEKRPFPVEIPPHRGEEVLEPAMQLFQVPGQVTGTPAELRLVPEELDRVPLRRVGRQPMTRQPGIVPIEPSYLAPA
jgi:hypothetical protein